MAAKLTDYIRDDLVRRIGTGERFAERVSVAALCREYGVSSTPMRAALGTLIRQGYVQKLPNQRIRIQAKSARRPVRAPAIAAPPTPGDRDNILLREVTLASLRRTAVYLREETLARKLGLGRSIVRQSLTRFAAAGLIEHIPRRGWLIHALNEEDMAAYLVVRETLELKALALAQARLQPADLQELLRANAPRGPRSARQLDNRLHDYIIEKSGNVYIRRFFQQYVARYYTGLFYHAAPETSVVGEMSRQHSDILKALGAGNWRKARRLLADHIRAQGPILTRLLRQEEIREGKGRHT